MKPEEIAEVVPQFDEAGNKKKTAKKPEPEKIIPANSPLKRRAATLKGDKTDLQAKNLKLNPQKVPPNKVGPKKKDGDSARDENAADDESRKADAQETSQVK